MLKRCLVPVLALATAIAALVGCSSNQGFNDNNDCDYIVAAGVDGELPMTTNRCFDGPLAIDMIVDVHFIGPTEGLGNPPEPTDLALFRLRHYDITYRNLDNNGTVAGVDVPFPTRVSLEFIVEPDGNAELTGYPVLKAGAKQDAPLNQSGFYSAASGVPFVATMTFWGHPLSDPDAWCFGQIDWYFTVFSDGC